MLALDWRENRQSRACEQKRCSRHLHCVSFDPSPCFGSGTRKPLMSLLACCRCTAHLYMSLSFHVSSGADFAVFSSSICTRMSSLPNDSLSDVSTLLIASFTPTMPMMRITAIPTLTPVLTLIPLRIFSAENSIGIMLRRLPPLDVRSHAHGGRARRHLQVPHSDRLCRAPSLHETANKNHPAHACRRQPRLVTQSCVKRVADHRRHRRRRVGGPLREHVHGRSGPGI